MSATINAIRPQPLFPLTVKVENDPKSGASVKVQIPNQDRTTLPSLVLVLVLSGTLPTTARTLLLPPARRRNHFVKRHRRRKTSEDKPNRPSLELTMPICSLGLNTRTFHQGFLYCLPMISIFLNAMPFAALHGAADSKHHHKI